MYGVSEPVRIVAGSYTQRGLAQGFQKTATVGARIGLPAASVRRHVADLTSLGVIDRVGWVRRQNGGRSRT
jgi:predicted ArsR family transcriptional regulator